MGWNWLTTWRLRAIWLREAIVEFSTVALWMYGLPCPSRDKALLRPVNFLQTAHFVGCLVNSTGRHHESIITVCFHTVQRIEWPKIWSTVDFDLLVKVWSWLPLFIATVFDFDALKNHRFDHRHALSPSWNCCKQSLWTSETRRIRGMARNGVGKKKPQILINSFGVSYLVLHILMLTV